MASSLDKLRALTDRLEDKLIEKKKGQLDISPVSVHEGKLSSNESVSEQETVIQETAIQETTVIDKVEVIEDVKPLVDVIIPDLIESEELEEELSQQVREENVVIIENLYNELKIYEKSPDFDNIFVYKAMNLSGIGLKEEDFGEVRAGKYIQVIAITYEPDENGKKKAKNISLGYFGKGDTIDPILKNKIIEFVLRWRYEKAFQNVQHYKELIAKLQIPTE